MVKTASTMLPLGSQAPDFTLTDTISGNVVSLNQFAGQPLLVMFICNHCPFVIHLRSHLAAFAKEYMPKGLKIVAISSNDISTHPQDGPEQMKVEAQTQGYIFPYLFDATQAVAKAYQAACTPDFFLFDQAQRLVYRGQFDDSRPKTEIPVTGKDLKSAVDAVLNDQPIMAQQKPSIGCNIKWIAGQEPAYFTGISAV